MSVTRLYHYGGCSTCREARRWLEGRGIAFEAIDLVQSPPDVETLRDLWLRRRGVLQEFFNVAGQSYRAGGFKERMGQMSDQERLEALAADGKLIKRPILDSPEGVLVGFRPVIWAAVLEERR